MTNLKLAVQVFFLFLASVNYTFGRSVVSVDDEIDPAICSSCKTIVGFSKRLVDTADSRELQNNLTDWCVESGHGANKLVCSYYVVDGMSALNRFGADNFCEKIGACPSSELSSPALIGGLEDVQSSNSQGNVDTPSCDFCLNIITHVREILASKETEQEIKQFAVNACKHVGSLRDECTEVLDKNLDNAFKFLREQLNPQSVCHSMGCCTDQAIDVPPSLPSIEEVDNVVDTGDEVVRGEPLESVERISVPLIRLTPARRIEVSSIPPVVIPSTTTSPLTSNPLDCLLCKQVAAWVMKKLKDNKTEVAVVQALDEVCDRLFKTGKKLDCEQFVKQYAHEAIQFIIQEDDPKTVCQLLGVCHHRRTEEAHRLRGSEEGDMSRRTESTANVEKEEKEEPSSRNNCWSCLSGADFIHERMVKFEHYDNQEEVVTSALEDVCIAVLPEEEECPTFVAEFESDIRMYINRTSNVKNKQLRSAIICSSLELCPWKELTGQEMISILEGETGGVFASDFGPVEFDAGSPGHPDSDENREPSESTSNERSLPTCFVCKRILKYINQNIGSNRSEAAIDAALNDICHVLRDISNCHTKIAEWRDEIVRVIQTASGNDDIACILMGVCAVNDNQEGQPDSESEPEITTTPAPSKSVCVECRNIAHFIQTQLYDYNKEKQVDDFIIDNVCDKALDQTVRETCESFINEYGPAIMQVIAQKAFDPNVVCEKELRICPPQETSSNPSPSTSSTPSLDIDFVIMEPRSQRSCDACVKAVRELDALLAIEQIDRDISKVAAKICARIPSDRQRQCVTIIESFGPYFLQVIGRLSNPEAVCKSVDLCRTPGEVQLLGGHKCTFGPTYWCHTAAHAAACEATEYCRQSGSWSPVE